MQSIELKEFQIDTIKLIKNETNKIFEEILTTSTEIKLLNQ